MGTYFLGRTEDVAKTNPCDLLRVKSYAALKFANVSKSAQLVNPGNIFLASMLKPLQIFYPDNVFVQPGSHNTFSGT